MLTYAKNEADIRRGRTQGRINVGTAIISAKTEMFRIDIDDEECIHHLKVRILDPILLYHTVFCATHNIIIHFQTSINLVK